MAEEGYPPQPPVPPTGQPPQQAPQQPIAPGPAVPPPAYPGAMPPYPGPTPPVPERKSRMWLGCLIGAVITLFLLGGLCMLPFMFFASDPTGSGGMGMSGFGGGFGDAVAVIRVDGVIAGSGGSGMITPEDFLDQLEQAEEDESVKAIVLRVDSPGGTVAASEEVSRYVDECDKPVVVSVGDVGASGAYMLASQADEIIAMPGSAVGSIGVISEIPNVAGLLDKVGVEFQVITAGKYKDAGSPYRPLTDEEKKLIQGEVDEAYGQFIDIVASGRDMPRAEVEKLATGQVWSGEKAKQLGLVDSIGTYRDALDAAAKRGKIDGDYDVITYTDEFDELFGSLFGLSESISALAKDRTDPAQATRSALPR